VDKKITGTEEETCGRYLQALRGKIEKKKKEKRGRLERKALENSRKLKKADCVGLHKGTRQRALNLRYKKKAKKYGISAGQTKKPG